MAENGPHAGDVTAHQDHEIYPVNFKATNRIVNRPKKTLPNDDDDDDDMISPLLFY
jgi:hypothetical protein